MERSEQLEQGLQLPMLFSTDVRTTPVSDSPWAVDLLILLQRVTGVLTFSLGNLTEK